MLFDRSSFVFGSQMKAHTLPLYDAAARGVAVKSRLAVKGFRSFTLPQDFRMWQASPL